MLAGSRSARSLFCLYRRRFATESGGPPPPKTDLGASSAGEVAKEATSTGTSRSGVGSLLAGVAVVLTGIAVYQYRHLFHDYPIHPIILRPQDIPKTLPGQQPMTLDAPSVETTAIHKDEAATESESTVEASSPPSETMIPPKEEKVSETVKTSEEPKEVESKKDAIPPQIIDNTPIVELFSEALGEKARAQGHPISDPSNSMTDQDVKQLLSAVADPTLLTGKLLSAAVKEAAATKPNWPEFTAKQEQAAHDAAVFSLLLDTERKSSKITVTELENKFTESQSQVQTLKSTVTSTRVELTQKMETALQETEKKHQRYVEELKEKLALEAAKAAVEESTNRHKIIDQLRERVNVLSMSLNYWRDTLQSSKEAQQLALEVASLDRLLDRNDVGIQWSRTTQMVNVKDPVVYAALQCLSDGAIPSKRQLMQDFGKVRRHVESFSLMPSSGGGLLSQMTAALGARLKIHVPEAYNDGGDVTSCLDRAERALIDGSIAQSIALLRSVTQNSGAADLSASWVKDAERYAALQAVRKILLARAQELTAATLSLRISYIKRIVMWTAPK